MGTATIRRNGGGGGAGFGPVRRIVAPSQSSTPATQSTPRQTKAAFQTFYDPSRVIALDKLKVVSDLRTSGSERGEVQSGDDGALGPGSNGGAYATGIRDKVAVPATTQKGLTPGQLALIALGTYLVLGG